MISPFLQRLSVAAVLATAVAGYSSADVTAPYTWDFSKEIDTSDHAFKVGPNWGHIVGTYNDYGTLHYMKYSYEATSGVNDSQCLKANAQESVSDYSWDDNGEVTDVLITPRVKGDVKIKVKKVYSYSSTPYIEVYEINADGTLGKQINAVRGANIGDSNYEWYELDLATGLEDYKRLGLRCQLLYIDDFTATAADIVKEPGMKFASVTPSGAEVTSNQITWDQQPGGKIKVDFKVTMTNTGQLPLTQGMDNYSITLFKSSSYAGNTDLVTVPVPVDLALGATSGEFTVSAELDPTVWGYAGAGINLNLRENLSGTIYTPVQSYYNAYEPVLIFREEGTDRSSSLSDPVAFGFISESKSKAFEIYNDGRAPLTVKSLTLPAGYTSNAPEGEFTVAPREKQLLTITLPSDKKGTYEGDLSLVYPDGTGTERTYTLTLQGTVIGANTWVCDFGTDTGAYPEGSVADTGVDFYHNSTDYYLKGLTYNAEFITPLLHAEKDETMSFSAGYESWSSYNPPTVEVYFSKDRENWGEAVISLGSNQLSSQWTTQTVTAPETGDYYVKFVMPNGKIDNLCGFSRVKKDYDLYFKSIQCDETTQSGTEEDFKVTVIAPLALNASDYTLSLMNGDTKIADIPTQDFEANAKTTHELIVKFTPEVEKTTRMNLYVKATFKDKTEALSATHELTVENQPDFVFFDAGTSVSSYKPNNRSKAIDFGRINTPGSSMEFEIFNWGSAPLHVTSVTLPEGFSSNITSAVVDSRQRQPLTVTVSTETPGSYAGELVITYKDVDDADQQFKLPVSVTLLDPTKWHLSFTGTGTSDITWPAGTLHGKMMSGGKDGYSDDAAWYITSSSAINNEFITPRLHAEAGEIIEITAKKGSSYSYYDDPEIKVYAAPTREALLASEATDPELAATRRLLATIAETAEDENMQPTSEWKTFRVAMDQAGDYYLSLELNGQIRVSELYGYKLLKADHDLALKGYSIPDAAMQNVAGTMTIDVHNYALQAETPETYTLTAIVNGEEIPVTPTVDIPVNTSLNDAATAVPLAVRYYTVGTFPVQLRLATATQTLTTEAKNVTFTEEVASAEKQIGKLNNANGNYAPIRCNDKNSESVMLFNAAALGLNAGDRIGAITFKGYSEESSKDVEFKLKAYYEWTDDQTQAQPESGMYDVSKMTQVINDETPRKWTGVQGSSSNTVDQITLTFAEPLVYESGKSLRLVVSHNEANNWTSNVNFEQTNDYSNTYYHSSDTRSYFETGSWSSAAIPVMHLSLVVETSALRGTVTDGGEPVADAVVTCVSNDGDNVRYTATTDPTGHYSLNVIQNRRSYNVTASANGKEDFADGLRFEESTTDRDFTLADVVTIDRESATEPGSHTSAVVKFNLSLPEGMHAVVLPVSLTADEVAAIFGDDAEVSCFKESVLNGTTLHLTFTPAKVENDVLMKAGKPYLVNVKQATEPMRMRGKDVTADITPDSDLNVEINGTYAAKTVEKGMFLIEEGTFIPSMPGARAAASVLPFSAYAKVLNPDVASISYSIGVPSDVDEIEVEEIDADAEIFNLQGIRVRNPQTGIYIVNGKKVFIK